MQKVRYLPLLLPFLLLALALAPHKRNKTRQGRAGAGQSKGNERAMKGQERKQAIITGKEGLFKGNSP